MITVPTDFSDKQSWKDLRPFWIMKVALEDKVSGDETHYFGDKDMHITDSTTQIVKGLVNRWGTINQQLNVYSRRIAISDMRIEMNNAPFKSEDVGNDMIRFSDWMYDYYYVGRKVEIYMLIKGLDDLADAVKIYTGYMLPLEGIDNVRASLMLKDAIIKIFKGIPQTLVSDEYTDFLLEESNDKYIPVVYGKFTTDDDYFISRLSPGVPAEELEWVFSDKAISSIDEVWLLDENLGLMVWLDSNEYTATADDSGIATVVLDDTDDIDMNVHIYPLIAGESTNFGNVTNHRKAWDKDTDTFASLDLDANVTGGYAHLRGYFGDGASVDPGSIDEAVIMIRCKAYERVYPNDDMWWNYGGGSFYQRFNSSNSSTINLKKIIGRATSATSTTLTDTNQSSLWSTNEWAGWTVEIFAGTGSGQTRTITSNTTTQLTVPTWSTTPDSTSQYRIYSEDKWLSLDVTSWWNSNSIDLTNFHSSDGVTRDGYLCVTISATTARDFKYLDVYEIRIRVKYNGHVAYYTPAFNRENERDAINIGMFIECEGRTYGSWIEDVGRSSSYLEDDVIECPSGMIEDLLRTELSFGNDDIDVDSFDDAESDLSTYDSCSLVIQNRINLIKVIEKICYQFPLVFWISSEGKARVRALKNSGYSSDGTLYVNEINLDSIRIKDGDINQLINEVKINWLYKHQYEKFYEVHERTNSTSQDNYEQEEEIEIDADMIDDSDEASALSNFIAGTSGFFSTLRPIVQFDSEYPAVHIQYEIGDVVRIDSGLDDYLKYLGSSWSGKDFLIINKRISNEKLSFTLLFLE